MEPGCLPFREIPQATPLFLAFTSDFEKVKNFYPLPPQQWKKLAKSDDDFPADHRKKIVEILERQNRGWGATQKQLASIERFRHGARAIVTGQQLGLFGGPAFSFYKAITAIRLADELTRSGCDCVPIFWLASQDHDFAEISTATLRSANGDLRRLSLEATAAEDTPVGRIQLGKQIESLVAAASEVLGAGEAIELLRQSYRPDETFSTAMARLFTALFGDRGLLIIDPLDSALANLAQPIYENAARNAVALNQALLERGRELEAAGFHQQVKVTASSTLLFMELDGRRTAIRRANHGSSAGTKHFSQQELFAEIQRSPEKFSGNALLRPVLQDFLLPTVAYVGGPAEVAYFAQAAVVYEKLLGRITPILPRLSATILDARDQRLLSRYTIGLTEVLKHPKNLGEFLAAQALPDGIENKFAAAQQETDAALKGLEQSAAQLDPTLKDAAKRSAAKIRYQLQRLRHRTEVAELRRNQELDRHAKALAESLVPNADLQERQIAGISYFARFGRPLLDRLYQLDPGCVGHHILPL